MNRNFATEAVVLSLKPSGENNTLVTLITKDRGIIRASLYGGPKSRLKSLCSQWNAGTVYIYENPEKKQNKISDFDVKKYHLSFGENLFKSYSALLAAELVIRTECAGDITASWPLFNGFLDGLELSDENQGKAGLVRFLWRFAGISGLQPDTEECAQCGERFFPENVENLQLPSVMYYNTSGNSFVCPDCITRSFQEHSTSGFVPVSRKALTYLNAVSNLPPAEARQFPLDEESFFQLKKVVFSLAELCASGMLNTLNTGTGIL